MKKIFALLLVAFVLFGMGAPAHAISDGWEKFTRGCINAATGWMEVPTTMYQDSVDQNPVMGLTFGVVHGAAKAVHRSAAGILDVGFFALPPYDETLSPEYVF